MAYYEHLGGNKYRVVARDITKVNKPKKKQISRGPSRYRQVSA